MASPKVSIIVPVSAWETPRIPQAVWGIFRTVCENNWEISKKTFTFLQA